MSRAKATAHTISVPVLSVLGGALDCEALWRTDLAGTRRVRARIDRGKASRGETGIEAAKGAQSQRPLLNHE